METNKSKRIGYVLLVVALIIFLSVIYINNSRRHIPLVFSPKTMLDSLWVTYKEEYLEPETLRTLDKQQDNITTSEGQSYTMLRSVWMDDQETFDISWQWTQDNLRRSEDNLFSWLFGQRPDGTYGVLTNRGGQNSASDADTDIAIALIFAFSRWKDNTYLDAAKEIITDIWNHEVVIINNKPYLAANNLEKSMSNRVIINPSYFAPYAYKIFAEIDPIHDWKGLVDTSYQIMEESIVSNIDTSSSARLPPDWITIDRETGELRAAENESLTTNFGYDALRVPWRIALDWEWNRDERAQRVLRLLSFLDAEWRDKGSIYARYSHAGQVIDQYESPAMYGGVIGYFKTISPRIGKEVYEKKLQSLYSSDAQSWKTTLSYYDDNWAWFGIALYNELLPNLYSTNFQ